jgi:2-hydroxychromene-2-carboxylate isomerase
MNEMRERLAKELEQLQKTYKSGIITDKEFARGKERIEAKMRQVQEKAEKDRESRKIVQEILATPEEETAKVEVPEEKPRPVKVKTQIKKKQIKPAKRSVVPETEEGDSSYSKIIIFAGILFVILLFVLVRVFIAKPGIVPASENLTYNGTSTLEFYMDATCPYSKDSWQVLLDLKERYGDHLAVKVKNFPMSFESVAVANAIQCARDQDKHLAYLQRIFDNQENISNNTLRTYAWAEGIDVIEFNTCLDTSAHLDKIREDLKEGYGRGVRSSPTFFIDGEMVVGAKPIEYFQGILDQKLAVKG